MSVFTQAWFVWCVIVVIALPVLSIVLSEVQGVLERRGSSMTRPIWAFRTWVLPLAGLVILLAVIPDDIVSNDSNWFKFTATALGLLILNFAISSLNTALFVNADKGSWRRKMPTIFVDIVRIVIIAIGLAILFSWVWGADVGGLFTALGVTSLVLGLALQGAVGSVVEGLLLLFEQPFELGDWIKAGGVTGRVVEVNWRAVHIQTSEGLHIVPTASLAGSAFTNLSRPDSVFTESIESTFAKEDSPSVVMQVLRDVAQGVPGLVPSRPPSVTFLGAGAYVTSITAATFAGAAEARAVFLLRLWYAARRVNIALDGADIWKDESADDIKALLQQAAGRLHISAEEIDALVPRVDVERFAPGEVITPFGQLATAARWISEGQVALRVPYGRDGSIALMTLSRGDMMGQTTLTKQPAAFVTIASTALTVLTIPGAVFEELARGDSRLAREIGQEMDQRVRAVQKALTEVNGKVTSHTRL